MKLEEVILNDFKRQTKKETKDLDLIITLDDSYPELWGVVMESKDYGRVWNIRYNEKGEVLEIDEM